MNFKIWSSGILCYNFIKICSTILEILAEKDQGGDNTLLNIPILPEIEKKIVKPLKFIESQKLKKPLRGLWFFTTYSKTKVIRGHLRSKKYRTKNSPAKILLQNFDYKFLNFFSDSAPFSMLFHPIYMTKLYLQVENLTIGFILKSTTTVTVYKWYYHTVLHKWP